MWVHQSCRSYVTVAEVINSNCEVLKFRRTLVGDNLQLWLQLQDICRGTVLGNVKDSLVWGFDAKGFSVKSCYKIMKWSNLGFPQKYLWKIKIPLKVKVFLWLVNRKCILTKDVLYRRGWKKGNKLCLFCGMEKTIDHLFFQCSTARFVWNVPCCAFCFVRKPTSVRHLFGSWMNGFSNENRSLVRVGVAALLWSIWKTRNNACFRSIFPENPTAITNLVGHWMSTWSILQVKEINRDAINWGAKLFVQLSNEVFKASHGWRPMTRRLTS
jgi:hypothetical protein